MSRPSVFRVRPWNRATVRVAAELLLLAVAVTAVAGWIARWQVRETFDEQNRDELDRMGRAAEVELARLRREVHERLERVRASLLADAPAMARLLLEGGDLGVTAKPLMEGQGLDLLEILDEHDRVLSSGHRPAHRGLPSGGLATLEPEKVRLVASALDAGGAPAFVERLELQYGARSLRLVGGQRLGRDFLDRVAGRERAVMTGPGGAPPVVTSSAAESLVSEVTAWGARPATDGSPQTLGRWLAKTRPLGEGDDAGTARLVLLVDPSRAGRLMQRMTTSFLLLGGAVGGIAALAGLLIARGFTRRWSELLRAIDAIAAGHADYAFDVRAADELEQLRIRFSEMKRAVDRSLAVERVAGWREVARHLAHEVKNPLTPILTTVQNLRRVRRDSPERFESKFQEGVQVIEEEVQQLTRLVDRFKEFAEFPLPAPRPVELGMLVDRVVELFAAEDQVTLVRHVAPDLPRVELDPDQLSRALKNLCKNAIEALRDQPPASGSAPRVEIRAGIVDGMAEIEVTDNGPGFVVGAEHRIFEPYFTTKAQGTGLGMALTYRIVVDHGGTIVAGNRTEGGARVILRLPMRAGEGKSVTASMESEG